MLKFESYWETLPLNSTPVDIIHWYKGDTACQAILINPERDKIMIHFRFSSHLWSLNAAQMWVKTVSKGMKR